MVYSTSLASALSGVTRSQLQRWRSHIGGKPPVLTPESSTEGRIYYSFRDVVALRTCAYLRQSQSLQKIRKALDTARDIDQNVHLSELTFVSSGDTIVLRQSDEVAIDLVKHPHQQVIVDMVDVLGKFKNFREVEVLDFQNPKKHIEVSQHTLGGYPVIRDTRVPYNYVSELLTDGVKPSRIADFYPNVSPVAAKDAEEYSKYVAELSA